MLPEIMIREIVFKISDLHLAFTKKNLRHHHHYTIDWKSIIHRTDVLNSNPKNHFPVISSYVVDVHNRISFTIFIAYL